MHGTVESAVGALIEVSAGGVDVHAARLQAIVKRCGFGQAVTKGDFPDRAIRPVAEARIHCRKSGGVLRVHKAARNLRGTSRVVVRVRNCQCSRGVGVGVRGMG